MSNAFYGWKIQTLNQLNGWTIGGAVIQRHRRIYFWFVYVFGLFCCFVGYCKRSLVSLFLWWNAIPTTQWKLLWVVWIKVLQGDWQEDFWGTKGWGWEEDIWCRLKNINMKPFVIEEAELLDFLKTRKCVADLDFGCCN